jgi:hypothetical protein
MLTRIDVARRLKRSIATVRRLQEAGILDSEIDENGYHRFREEDVEELELNGIPKWAAQSDWLRGDEPAEHGETPIDWRHSAPMTNARRPVPRQRIRRRSPISASAQPRVANRAHEQRHAQPSRSSFVRETMTPQQIWEAISRLPRRQRREMQRQFATELEDE